MRRALAGAVVAAAISTPSLAQTPLPFPGAGAPPSQAPRATTPTPATAAPAPQQPTAQTAAPPTAAGANGPSASAVVFPIFPGSQFIGAYEAGKGQQYYLYGTTTPYLEVVTFYRTQLKDRGDEVFAEPPTHMFQQRYREETMSFPPGVTVKDWTYQSRGYPNPRQGAQPERFPTIVMLVPPPPAPAPAPAK